MMYFIGLLLAILVGLTLGMIGSGGSILTVPILVYILGVNPVLATTYSLFIVGTTSLVGAAKGIQSKTVDYNKILYFGLPSMVTVFIARSFLLPLVPDEFWIAGHLFHQDSVLMILFAFIMILASVPMIKGNRVDGASTVKAEPLLYVILQGVVVGFITGVVGAGGGFLIIPVLISSFGLTLKRAVSTSLVLITINSAIGLLGDIEKFHAFNWQLIGAYIVLSIIGLFIGFKVSSKIGNAVLKKSFGIGILLLSIAILIEELFML